MKCFASEDVTVHRRMEPIL